MKKIESSKMWKFHQTTTFFIAAFERRVSNSFLDHLDHPGNFFFSDHREVNLSKFRFFAKNHGKNNVFVIFGIPGLQKLWFFIGFFNKNEMGQNSKNQILHKNQSKITFFAFFVTIKIQKSSFLHGFSSKMSCDTPKNHDFFIFHLYTSKKWKKSWFLARTHFSNFEFT